MIGKKYLFAYLFLLQSCGTAAQDANRWADSVLKSLTEEQRIAQLIMVRLSSIDGRTRTVTFYNDAVEADIKKYNIGGICLFQGGPVKQTSLINRFQSIAKTPIMMAIDGETGVGMRVDSVTNLPRMMMLGALRDSSLVYDYGKWVAEQCKMMGIQVNFAPVADVNNNPNNPVINDRSFGENKYKVASHAVAYAKGMKDNGVMGSAKHFPGHGDVDVDSHLAMPIINKSREKLNDLELFPFKKLFEAGIGSTMVGHLFVPVLDSSANRPASVSKKTVTDLLRNELGFDGITFTDALEMKGVSNAYPGGAAAVESIIAGNDMLCLPGEVSMVIKKIKEAISSGKITMEQIDQHVLKVLKAKYASGLANWKPVSTERLAERLNAKSDQLKKAVAEKAITLARFEDRISFPIQPDRDGKYALVEIGKNRNSTFSLEIRKYYNADVFAFDNAMTSAMGDKLLSQLKSSSYDKIIVAIHELPRFPANNFNISGSVIELVNKINVTTPSNLFIFGNPYAAKSFCETKNIIIGYDDDPITQETAARMLTGKIGMQGQLPVSVCENLKAGNGFYISASAAMLSQDDQIEKASVVPTEKMQRIDSIINDAIQRKAAPGMALMVVKNGKIALEKTYGNLTYDNDEKVTQEVIYDMASVTKICATTLSIMKLYDDGKIKLEKTLADYLPWMKGSNKEKLLIKDILLHQAGLRSFIPFYKEIADSATNKALPGFFSKNKDSRYGIKVDDSLYMRTDWRDTLFKRILTSPVDPSKKYVYSDNDFILLGEIVRQISGLTLDEYAWKNFYRPLGFRSTGFNPTRFVDKKTIAPTEQDPYFRERLVRGFVHDPGAAMFGGVSGHAGLFSNAYEIAVLMQLVMNKGVMNNKRFFSEKTTELFTAYQSDISRRGYGFDKPEKNNASLKVPYPALAVSGTTFGHTGFTGTCAWADPEKNIVFVLHANRVHPIAKNTFGDLNVRGKVMEEVFR